MSGPPATYAYTGMELPNTVQYPDGGYLTYTYPSPTQVNLKTLQFGTTYEVDTTTLDGYGRTSGTDHQDLVNGDELVNYTYDAAGRLASISNPFRQGKTSTTDGTTRYAYDGANRVKTVTKQDSSAVTYSYSGQSVTVTDEAQKMRLLYVDAAGRTTSVQEPDSTGALTIVTTYAYDALNDLTSVSQQGGDPSYANYRNRSFTYDSAGRLLTSTTPEQGTITYQYDNGSGVLCSGTPSQQCSRTDANGTITTYSYDTLNRPTGAVYSGSGIGNSTPAVAYAYDQASANGLAIVNGLGRRTSMTDGSGATAWSFDAMGRPTSIRKTINGVTKPATIGYNPDGTTSTITDFGGTTANYSYNAMGLPLSVVDPSGPNFATSAAYAAPGVLTGLVQGFAGGFQGITSTNTYNARLQPTLLSAAAPSTVFSLSYVYGQPYHDNGDISGITNGMDGTRSQSFTYDNMNRVATAQAGTSWGNTYVYDNWSNLLQKNPLAGAGQGETLQATANVNNQLVGAGMTYDAAGEVTVDNMGNHWSYDAEGRALTVNGETYAYDGDGNRVMKTGGSNARIYWPLGLGTVANESDLAGNMQERNVYLNGQMIARADTSTGAVHYLLQDHLGSERVSVSASGTVEDSIEYFPWGAQTPASTMQSGNLYTFTGDETDMGESSTMHTPFRQLSPSLGRWQVPDPYNGSYDTTNPQTLNRYSYVANMPLTMLDPLGLVEIPCPAGSDATICVINGPPDGSGGGDGGGDGGGGGGGGVGGSGGGGAGGSGGGGAGGPSTPGKKPPPSKANQLPCKGGVLAAAALYGLGNALGAGAPGSDPAGDVAGTVRDAAGNPIVQASVGVMAARLGATLLTQAGAAELGALASEYGVPAVGVAASIYIVYSSFQDASTYYNDQMDSGVCAP
ncbi:MAG: RHS repeat-associated core domain-containing protein [Acidobacteriaceae bacterium]